ncbi:MAG: M28 family peptidase [Bacteroidales bacterium]|nr:M28 family peptidase [Bacteroidales bacterium]
MKKLLFIMSIVMLHSCSNNNSSLEPSENYYVEVVKELSADKYYGRSNYNNGNIKAGEYILSQIEALGVKTVPQEIVNAAWEGKEKPALHSLQPEFKSLITPCDARRFSHATTEQLSYMKHFNFPLNAQRGAVELIADGDTLKHTIDYTLKEFSPTYKGELEVVYLDNKYLHPDKFCTYLNSGEFKDKAVVLDWDCFRETMYTYPGIEVYKTYFVPLDKVGALICRGKELLPYFKSRNHFNTPMPVFITNEAFPENAKKVSINVEAEMIDHDAHNIIAFIPGTEDTQKHFILACHYDHLGICGEKEIFNGANDNSSGTAMLLNLMRHFKLNPPKYSVMFIFFDAEENNLLGSFFYADNPVLPLEDIQYFIELDMIGDNGNNIYSQISDPGEEGLAFLNKINSSMENPFAKLDRHPMDDYADHYPFGLKGVPAIYIELDGDTNKNYHSPRDTFENFYSNNYNRLFALVKGFVEGYR